MIRLHTSPVSSAVKKLAVLQLRGIFTLSKLDVVSLAFRLCAGWAFLLGMIYLLRFLHFPPQCWLTSSHPSDICSAVTSSMTPPCLNWVRVSIHTPWASSTLLLIMLCCNYWYTYLYTTIWIWNLREQRWYLTLYCMFRARYITGVLLCKIIEIIIAVDWINNWK